MEFIIKDTGGITVKSFIRRELALSGRLTTRLKQDPAGITVNGEHATVRKVLNPGDVLALRLEDTEDGAGVISSAGPLDILFEDGHIIAVNKPAGMPTHPSFNHYGDTLANRVAAHCRVGGTPFVFRAVNRLDRDTTGVVLIAKDALTAQRLNRAMARREIVKTYRAALSGDLNGADAGSLDAGLRPQGGSFAFDGESGCITAPIKREAGGIMRRICAPDGGYAVTRFRIIPDCGLWGGMPGSTCAEVYPETGRTHQIRVHFARLGYPICGDTLYGDPEDSREMALHAYSIAFPYGEGVLTVRAEIRNRP